MITLTTDHRYIDESGREYPGVTTVIRDAGLMGYIPNDDWYSERGTAVHLATALYDRNDLDESTVDPQIVGYLNAWKLYRRDLMPAVATEYIEVLLHNSVSGYCGTMDRYALDIKTGVKCAWHVIQAAAYWQAIGRTRPLSWQSVYLREDGRYTVETYDPVSLTRAFNTFNHALPIYNWKKENL